MKILIPPAKEMKIQSTDYFDTDINIKTAIILDELLKLDIETFAKIYKISIERAINEKEKLKNIKEKNAKNCEALFLFDGLMYRNIERFSLSEREKDYLKSYVFITSSFYGIINIYEKIALHRLDFLQNIKINELSLKKYWQQDYDNFVKDDDLIISLLSSEFEEVFSKNIREKFIKVLFMEEISGNFKVHSTISKKARGKFLSVLVRENITNIQDIKNIMFDGYVFNEKLSSDKKLVFISKRGE